ncbi:hypothetical protein LSG31_19380 [Fodinisporobacter ferrooxydans]|uniref:Uncharacterized protein n=1 Tax=Fodinisporobacter ferrooxydans TaxID=2901836 RepID=A0ABY4CJ05_9BACL|nr:hypothetical protein LSG31_19380 [Alicyclobacillaceae bacterium MYW30-H2]
MLWTEVRQLYPEQFVLVEEIKSHYEGNKVYVEEVAVIRPVSDDETLKVLRECKGDRFIYHTSKDRIVMEVLVKPAIKRSAYEN